MLLFTEAPLEFLRFSEPVRKFAIRSLRAKLEVRPGCSSAVDGISDACQALQDQPLHKGPVFPSLPLQQISHFFSALVSGAGFSCRAGGMGLQRSDSGACYLARLRQTLLHRCNRHRVLSAVGLLWHIR